MQQILQRLAMGPPPFSLPTIGAEVRTHGHADAVVDEMAKQTVQGSLAIELIEDQPYNRLHLLVRVEGRRPTRDADIADRRWPVQLAATGLVQLTLVPPFLEDVPWASLRVPLSPNKSRSL
jgi:hypothetical protein